MKKEIDLFGNIIERKATYWVFHDESIPNNRWFIIGLIFVKEEDLIDVVKILKSYLKKENYNSEIHSSRLPKKFQGEYGAKARIALNWLKAFEEGLSDYAKFSALAVDRFSPSYDHSRFSKEYHAYNRFTAITMSLFRKVLIIYIDSVRLPTLSFTNRLKLSNIFSLKSSGF